MADDIQIPQEAVIAFCHRWKITSLSLFGSVLGSEFGPESDVDVLVAFSSESQWTLLDFVTMEEELSALFKRHVDLVDRDCLDNPFKRDAILRSLRTIYAA